MKTEGLSILIPSYNHDCTVLAEALLRQANNSHCRYELVIGDDGSDAPPAISAFATIARVPHCRIVRHETNRGRSAMRNTLAREAHYDRLLFIDAHMSVLSKNYLANYLSAPSSQLVYGGYSVPEGLAVYRGNLRYRYEYSCQHLNKSTQKELHPYADFHTSNFMIPRDVMLAHPFDERIRRYGYEDVLFGKQLAQSGIAITYIDNPVGFDSFESNALFLKKTEEGLRTLCEWQESLRGYSRLLAGMERLDHWHLSGLLRFWHRCFGRLERRQLIGRHPSLFLFKLYRAGTFACGFRE